MHAATAANAHGELESLGPALEFFSRTTGLVAILCVEQGGGLRVIARASGAERSLPCALMQTDEDLFAHCFRSDLHHFRLAHRLGRYLIYACPAGMVDIIVPVPSSPVPAAVFSGEVLPRPLSAEERGRLAQRLSTPKTSAARLRRAFARTRFMPAERIEAAAKMLTELIQYAIGPSKGSDLAPLRTYVASELLRRQEWHELEGIARVAKVASPPRVAIVIQVLQPGWLEAVDWDGLNQAHDLVLKQMPSSLAVVGGDKLVVLCSDTRGLRGRIQRLFSALRAMRLRVVIGVGPIRDGDQQIWESYHDAELALGYRFLTENPVIFLDDVEREAPSSTIIPSALRDLALLLRLGNISRAREVVHALVQELGREPRSSLALLDSAVEILTVLIHELRDAGSTSRALPSVLRHFLTDANRVASVGEVLALLEASAIRLINQHRSAAHTTAELVERVCEHIQSHLDEPVALESLCEGVLFVSPDHFSRTFQKVKGRRFKDWVREQRIERAKELLASTSEAISSVGSRCGYDLHPYFCRVFRQETGMTPTQYRQACARGSSTVSSQASSG